jgi:hypothetical protein
MAHLHFGFETVRNVSLSQLQVQEADHPQKIEKTEEKGGKLPVNLVKLAKIAISPVLGKGLAEFEVALRILNFLMRYSKVEGNPGLPEIFVTPIFLSSPVFSENPIGHSVALLLISASMGLPTHLHIMGHP